MGSTAVGTAQLEGTVNKSKLYSKGGASENLDLGRAQQDSLSMMENVWFCRCGSDSFTSLPLAGISPDLGRTTGLPRNVQLFHVRWSSEMESSFSASPRYSGLLSSKTKHQDQTYCV